MKTSAFSPARSKLLYEFLTANNCDGEMTFFNDLSSLAAVALLVKSWGKFIQIVENIHQISRTKRFFFLLQFQNSWRRQSFFFLSFRGKRARELDVFTSISLSIFIHRIEGIAQSKESFLLTSLLT